MGTGGGLRDVRGMGEEGRYETKSAWHDDAESIDDETAYLARRYGIGAGTASDRQLRWMQRVLLKATLHSDRCMGTHVTEIQ